MAIVKSNFTRSRNKIKATLRYITHRPGRAGEKMTRTLFGFDGEMSKQEAYQMIDAQKGVTYFRVVFNFDAKREDTRKDLNLRDITKQAILALEERLQRTIRFLAVEHNDHSPLRHIHAIVMMKLARGERVLKEDWKVCREVATAQALMQRRALEAVRSYQRDVHHKRVFSESARTRFAGLAGGRARRLRNARQPTIPCPYGGMHSMVKLEDNKYWCPVHKRVQERSQGLSL
jgi:hypothetical protein